MEIISYVQAVVGRQFAFDEVQPVNGAPYNTFVGAVQSRYGFQSTGISIEAQQKGITAPVFQIGEFKFGTSTNTIMGLEFTADGLRATSYKTEVVEAFLDDLAAFAQKSFGYRIENISKRAVYGSAVLIRLNSEDLALFSFLDRPSRLLTEEYASLNKERTVGPFGMRLIVSSNENQTADSMCILEKRVGAESGKDVYYSQAPLPTASHENFLRRLFSPE